MLASITPAWGKVKGVVERWWSRPEARGLSGGLSASPAARVDAELGDGLQPERSGRLDAVRQKLAGARKLSIESIAFVISPHASDGFLQLYQFDGSELKPWRTLPCTSGECRFEGTWEVTFVTDDVPDWVGYLFYVSGTGYFVYSPQGLRDCHDFE